MLVMEMCKAICEMQCDVQSDYLKKWIKVTVCVLMMINEHRHFILCHITRMPSRVLLQSSKLCAASTCHSVDC